MQYNCIYCNYCLFKINIYLLDIAAWKQYIAIYCFPALITKTIFLSCIWYNFIIITTTQLTKNASNNIVLIQVFSNAATDKEKSNYTSTKRTTARRRIDEKIEKIKTGNSCYWLIGQSLKIIPLSPPSTISRTPSL